MRKSGLDKLRDLAAVYWQPLITLLLGIPTAFNAAADFFPDVKGLPVVIQNENRRYVLLASAIVLLILVRFPKIAFLVTRVLLPSAPPPPPPERRIFLGPQSYGENDASIFFGRTQEADDCLRHVRDWPFTIIEGESGCGKSSLVNAALIPALRASHQVVLCRPGAQPFAAVHAALVAAGHKPPAEAPATNSPEDVEARVRAMLAQIRRDTSEPPKDAPAPVSDAPISPTASRLPVLLILDQFEEIFVNVVDARRAAFMAIVRETIEGGFARVVLVTRSDFLDLVLRLCREVDPELRTLDTGQYYSLRAFDRDQASFVLDRMLAPLRGTGNDPLLADRLEQFQRELVADLLRPPRDTRLSRDDTHRVLPVELQTVGMTLEALGPTTFSGSEFRRLGRKAGLYRHYIEDTKTYVYRKTTVPGDASLLMLRKLVSPAGTKWAVTANQVAEGSGYSPALTTSVLDAFADKYLVREIPPLEPNGERPIKRYELQHESLVHVLREAPDPVLQKARDAEERLHFWTERVSDDMAGGADENRFVRFFRFWRQPIPLLEAFRLWRYANPRGRALLRANVRAFAVRVATLAGVGAVGAGIWFMIASTDARVVATVTGRAPVAELQSGQGNDTLLLNWIRALCYGGHVEAAESAAQQLKSPAIRSVAGVLIAHAHTRAAQSQAALERLAIALRESDREFSNEQRAAITHTLREALARGATPNTILNPVTRAVVRARTAVVLIDAALDAGQQEAAGIAIETALDTLTTVSDIEAAADSYAALVRTCLRRHLPAQAKRAVTAMIARLPRDKNFSGSHFRDAAALAVRVDDWDSALAAYREGIVRSSGSQDTEQAVTTVAGLLRAGKRDALDALGKEFAPDSNSFATTLHLLLAITSRRSPTADRLHSLGGYTENCLSALTELIAQGELPELRQPTLNALAMVYRDGSPIGLNPGSIDTDGYTRLRITTSLLEIDETDLAFRIAESIHGRSISFDEDPYGRFLRRAIAKGHLDRAAQRLDRVRAPLDRNLVIETLIISFLDQKKTAEATKWTSQLQSEQGDRFPSRVRHPHAKLAEAWVKQEGKERALAIIALVPEGAEKNNLCESLAVTFSRSGRQDDVEAMLREIDSDVRRSSALATVAIDLTRRKKLDDAKAMLERIPHEWEKSRVRAAMALDAASIGQLHGAVKIASTCTSPEDKIRAYAWIVLVHAVGQSQSPELTASANELQKLIQRSIDPSLPTG